MLYHLLLDILTRKSNEAILFVYTYYLSAHFRRLLAIFVLIFNIFINHNANTPAFKTKVGVFFCI